MYFYGNQSTTQFKNITYFPAVKVSIGLHDLMNLIKISLVSLNSVEL